MDVKTNGFVVANECPKANIYRIKKRISHVAALNFSQQTINANAVYER